MQESRTEPELDWVDVALLQAWWELNSELCSLCGRPLAVHEDDSVEDYIPGFRECTATKALDIFQAKPPAELEAKDKAARDQKRDPERARSWFAYTRREGPPRY